MHTTTWMSVIGLLATGCGEMPSVRAADDQPLAREEQSDDEGEGEDEDEDDDSPLYPADELVEGQTLSQWNARWWEWLVSIPAAQSPARGGDCTQNQGGDVFFLTTTFGGAPQVRTCTVPEDTPIFIPTVSSIIFGCVEVWGVEDCPWSLEENIVPYGQELADARASLYTYSVTLDGVAIDGLQDYVLDSSVAWLDYDGADPSVLFRQKDRYGPGIPAEDVDCARGFEAGNVCSFEPGPKAAATLGHAVLLRPLDDDQPHTLHVTGSLGTFAVDVTYTLTVED